MDIRAMLKAGIRITQDELDAAELVGLMIVEQEINEYEREISEKK